MRPIRRWGCALLALVLTATFGMPFALPAAAQSLPGYTLPPGVTLPSLPSGMLQTLEQQFQSTGRLPAQVSSQELAAFLNAPSGSLPPALASLAGQLGQLAGSSLTTTLAHQVACLLASYQAGQVPFTDLTGVPWAQGAIAALRDAGIVAGTGAGAFDPEGTLTQEQWLVMLTHGLNLAPPAGAAPVPGVASWAQTAVQQALAEGLLPSGGGISLDPAGGVDRYQAVTLLVRALGLGGVAQETAQQPYPFQPTAPVPSWAQGPVTLAYHLGLVSGIGNGRFGGDQPLTRAQVAVLMAKALQLFAKILKATGKPAITGVSPSPLGAGLSATLTGQGLGTQAGSVTWQSIGGASQPLTVTAWTYASITVQVPADATPGKGELTVITAGGERATAPAQVAAAALSFGKPLPDGQVPMLLDGKTYYVSPGEVAGLKALTPDLQSQLGEQLRLKLSRGGAPAIPGQPPAYAPSPLTVRAAADPAGTAADPSGGTSPCQGGCETIYGPGITPYSPSLSSAQVSYDVPCTKVLGYEVCSGSADAESLLGGLVNGAGFPNGYFTQVGAAFCGTCLITGASMDATLGLAYQPKAPGDFVRVEAKVITNQVEGGVGVAGAGVAPVHVYTAGNGVGQQEDTVASRLDTMSASVASWPDLSAADLAEESLSDLDAINDTAQSLWQLDGLPGETGKAHVSTFTWSGYAPADGSPLDISLDTQAVVASNGVAQTEVNAVDGVVLVKVREYSSPPPAPTACTGASASATIASVAPADAGWGATISVTGSGFEAPGLVELYSPTNTTVDLAQVVSWSSTSVSFRLPPLAPGAYQMWIAPSDPCVKPVSADLTVDPPQSEGIQMGHSSWQGTALTVTGRHFGSAFASYPALDSELFLTPPAGGQAIPLVPDSWSSSGFTVTGPFLGPGPYRLTLVQHYRDYNGGYLPNSNHSLAGTQDSLGLFYAVPYPTTFTKDVTIDLGTVTIPRVVLDGLSPSKVAPGSIVTATGQGFGAVPGSVWLTVGAFPVSEDNAEGVVSSPAPTYIIPAADVTGWSDNQVVFRLPRNVRPGDYGVYVLPPGYASWQEEAGPNLPALQVVQSCACCTTAGP